MAARPHPRCMPDPMKETPTDVPMAWIDGSKEAAATPAALPLAASVHRPAEAARAHAVLACAMAAQGNHAGADEHLAAAREGGAHVAHHVRELCLSAEQRMIDVPKETLWQ